MERRTNHSDHSEILRTNQQNQCSNRHPACETALPLIRQDRRRHLEQFAERAKQRQRIGHRYQPIYARRQRLRNAVINLSDYHNSTPDAIPLLRQEPPHSIWRIQTIARHYRAPL